MTASRSDEQEAIERRRELAVLRLAHLLQTVAWGLVIAFEALLLHRRGLSPSDTGTVLLLIQGVALGAGFFWGALADRTGRMREIALVGSLLFGLTLVFGARVTSFSGFLAYGVLRGLTQPMVLALMPALAVSVLPAGARGKTFASYRVFGPLGYMTGTLVVPLLLADVGGYLTAAGCAMVAGALPLFFGKVKPPPRPPRSDLLRALRAAPVSFFLVSMFLFATAQHAAFFYLPMYADSLGASERLIGALTSMNGLTGLIALPLVGVVIDRVGARVVLIAALLSQPLRMLGVAAITDDPTGLFLPQLLHLVAFTGPELAAVLYITEVTPPSDRGASVALLLAVLIAGMGVGAKLSGFIADGWGFRTMYVAAAATSSLGAILFLSYHGASRLLGEKPLSGDPQRAR